MFVKLFASILDSSIWFETNATRIVWITMLAMADENGVVSASTQGIQHRANVTPEEGLAAIRTLEGPDLDSKDQSWGGRRIEKIDGGWQLLNYQKYRELRSKKQVVDAARQARWRDSQRKIDEQKGVCDCCKEPFQLPHSKYVCQDHDHATGAFRAMICQSCNKVVGLVETNKAYHGPKRDLATAYIKRWASVVTSHNVTQSHDGVTNPDVTVEAEAEEEADTKRKTSVDGSKNVTVTPPDNGNETAVWISQALATVSPDHFVEQRYLWEGRALFAFWQWRSGKNGKVVIFTDDRKRRTARYLKIYGLEACLYAVEGAFHHPDMHPESGKTFTDFENIFMLQQGSGRVEKLRDAGEKHPDAVTRILKALTAKGWAPPA